jgi:DNA primase
MFPVLSTAGEPIGFGARALRRETEPKYLNSPETAVYKKANVLFGLPQARAAIKEEGAVLIVEGYFDVLSLASAGIRHAVAPCGTAFTPAHVRLLLRYTQQLLFLFDGDAAGERAAWRALETTLPIHPDVGIVSLPVGKDPDDLVREGQLAVLREHLAAARGPVAFASKSLERESVDGHARVRRIASLLASVGNGVAREMMIEELAEEARIPGRAVRQEVDRLRSRWRRRPQQEGRPPGRPALSRLTPLEEALLWLAHQDPETAGPLRDAARGVPAVHAGVHDALDWIAERAGSGVVPAVAELVQQLRNEFGAEISVGFLMGQQPPVAAEQYRSDLLRRLQELRLEAEKEELGHRVRQLESQGGPEGQVAELLERIQGLALQLAQLREEGRRAGV